MKPKKPKNQKTAKSHLQFTQKGTRIAKQLLTAIICLVGPSLTEMRLDFLESPKIPLNPEIVPQKQRTTYKILTREEIRKINAKKYQKKFEQNRLTNSGLKKTDLVPFRLEENNRHLKGVNSLVYSPALQLFVSGSWDQNIGRWNLGLQPDSRFSGALITQNVTFNDDGNLVSAQILRMKGVEISGVLWLVANLNGRYLRVLNFTNGTEFDTVFDHSLENESVNVDGFALVPNSPNMIFASEKKLFKFDFKEGVVRNSTSNGDVKYNKVVALDSDRVLCHGVDTAQFKKVLSLYNATTLENIQDFTMNASVHYMKSLAGIFIDGSSEEEAEAQSSFVFLSLVNAKVEIYKDALSFNNEPYKKFEKIHGFYAVEAMAVVTGSSYIYTGSGDGFVKLWDINYQGTGLPPTKEVEFKASIFEIIFNRKLGKVFIAKNYDPIGPMDRNPLVSFDSCLIDNCILCPGASDSCEGCNFGYLFDEDNNRCLDCSKTTNGDHACNKIRRNWMLVEEEITSRIANVQVDDGYGGKITIKHSGKLFKIIVQDVFPNWLGSFPPEASSLNSKFELEIEDVNRKDFNYTYVTHDGDMFLIMNFTTDFNNKKMSLWNTDNVLIQGANPTKSLILLQKTEVVYLSGREMITPEILEGFGNAGQVAGTVLTSVALVTSGLAFFNVCMPFGAGSFILSFFQIIEIVSRLSYINVNFGNILTSLLEGLDEAISLPQLPIQNIVLNLPLSALQFDTRGKLSLYEVAPLGLSTIPIFLVVYPVSLLFPYISSRNFFL